MPDLKENNGESNDDIKEKIDRLREVIKKKEK